METNVETFGQKRSKEPQAPFVEDPKTHPDATGEPLMIRQQRVLVHDLIELVAECVSREPEIESRFQTRNQEAERHFEARYQDAIVKFASEKESLEAGIQEARRSITARYETEIGQAEREFTLERRRIIEQYEDEKEAAKSEFQETRWTITAVHEGSKSGTEKSAQEMQEQVAEYARRCRTLRQEAVDYLQQCRLGVDLPVDLKATTATMADFDPAELVPQQIELAETKFQALRSLRTPRYLRGERFLWIMATVWLLAIPLSALGIGWLWGSFVAGWLYGSLGGSLGVLFIGLGIYVWLFSIAKAQVKEIGQPLFLALARAEGLLQSCRDEATFYYHQQLGEGTQQYKKELRQITETYRRRRQEMKQRRIENLRRIHEKYRGERAAARKRRAADWNAATEKYRLGHHHIQHSFDDISQRLHETQHRVSTENQAQYDRARASLNQRWSEGLAHVQGEVTELNAQCRRLCPEWSNSSWNQWRPAQGIPPALRFGEFHVKMAEILGDVPASSLLRKTQDVYPFPALMPFPNFCSLLVKAREEGKTLATQLFQTVMLRLLAGLPPGKLRFTIIDPVGLGRNFASFMHLADYDEALVNSRIWTEMPHIDQKLADLTEHMETVIQKYLRDQFPSIEDYNIHAQEVAEPYRFLVVANFPVNFSSDAIRRLVSIIQSGPRCGVYTLISVDLSQPLPAGFSYSDLEQPGGIQLEWEENRFKWQDGDFADFPLLLDSPPGADFSARLLRQIGEKAKEAKRVEVPFEFVAPAPTQWWKANSKSGIDVPLGRVGATKRQYLRLGQGTSQHVLIAGKTGSGKSTFLHALISNLSLCYSPQEIELYLVDFKKGVEFKTYASHELPHARVIAIESEREFGLSVLQCLDAELKHRADLFRAMGAQELASYRDSNGSLQLPRILLIVDEFQEFFVEDDKIAQDASLLLDRLVRQGRAFGLHVLLGSQTLGGAYTLARSTIDQMAVRIALQCSEADAHLILSHDNSAARLLSRPGEAIYNDANGLVEGNNPFQIVWLSDERREFYLTKVQELARSGDSGPVSHRSREGQIVFEGNAPADASKNILLNRLILEPGLSDDSTAYTAWLGEAIAIKDPTAAAFTPQSGSNLLVVGQNDTAALGIISTALISLAAQVKPQDGEAPGSSRVYVLDGSPEDSPHAGHLARLATMLGPQCKVGGRRELPALIAELAGETTRRLNDNPSEPPATFLLVYGLHRFRDLRRQEDDFGFAAQAQDKQNPANQFAEILKEGPALGIHTLAWCDSLNNLTRTLDRQSLREFELRVLFQMSANDSSTLIDSPLASKLGIHRALFCSEEQGKLEKFRPYGLPAGEWLEFVQKHLESRNNCTVPANDLLESSVSPKWARAGEENQS
jgi:DNA segregation ATPase FtsK/SpoIIIE, S-DNA-T family